MRDELLNRIHMGKAFWWLPSFDEQVWLLQTDDFSKCHILRLLGLSFAEIIYPGDDRLNPIPLGLKKLPQLVGRHLFTVDAANEKTHLYFGMYGDDTPSSLGTMAFRTDLRRAHSAYPKPVSVQKLNI